MTKTKICKTPKRRKLGPIDTESEEYIRETEDTYRKAEEMRQAADTLLRLNLTQGF